MDNMTKSVTYIDNTCYIKDKLLNTLYFMLPENFNEEFLDTNEWVPIHTLPGFESCIEYFINRDGEVLSHKGKKPRLLVPCPLSEGYLRVNIQQRIGKKQPKCVPVHKLVAFAFLEPPPVPYGKTKGCCNIDHIDGNKLNNHISNLQWMSCRDNMFKSKGLENPTKQQLTSRKIAKKYTEDIYSDPVRLEKRRKYFREYMRRKRAAEKQVKIEEHND